MCEPVYELKVASHDLKPAETYHQLCQSLQLLSETCDAVFNTIEKRVDAEREKLGGLARRIQSAWVRVEDIAGSSKAIKILSSSKYPAPSPGFADHSCLFQPSHHKKPGRALPPPPLNGDWKSGPRGSEESLQLFSFFTSTAHEPVLRQSQPTVGLGGPPVGVRSVADMMLFNSEELPHHKYNIVDNLAGGGYGSPQREGRAAAADSLLPPPTSIFDSQSRRGGVSDDFGFRPTLGDVPSFSLPLSLPDLPMAADISWTGASGSRDRLPSIAPSAGSTFRSPEAAPPESPAPLSAGNPPLQSSPEPTIKPPTPPRQPSSTQSPQQPSPQPLIRPATPTPGSRHSLEQLPPTSTFREQPPRSEAASPVHQSASTMRPAASPSPILPVRAPEATPSLPTISEPKPELPATNPSSMHLPPPPPPPPPRPPPLLTKSATVGSRTAVSRELSDPSAAPLPQLDSVRAALLESIRNPSISLRKTGKGLECTKAGQPTFDRRGTAPPLRPSKVGGSDIFAEMASSLNMRRLSMQGSTVGALQGRGKESLPALSDDESLAGGSGRHLADEGEKLQMPIANVRAYITRKDEAQSDDDEDWEDE